MTVSFNDPFRRKNLNALKWGEGETIEHRDTVPNGRCKYYKLEERLSIFCRTPRKPSLQYACITCCLRQKLKTLSHFVVGPSSVTAKLMFFRES